MRLDKAAMAVRNAVEGGMRTYSTGDLARLLNEPRRGPRLSGTITRLVNAGYITRIMRGVYIAGRVSDIPPAQRLDRLREAIAVFRRHDLTVEALETAANQHGMVSQYYMRKVSCITTGRSACLRTPLGEAELVHTDIGDAFLRAHSNHVGSALMLADAELTLMSLQNTRRDSRLEIEED